LPLEKVVDYRFKTDGNEERLSMKLLWKDPRVTEWVDYRYFSTRLSPEGVNIVLKYCQKNQDDDRSLKKSIVAVGGLTLNPHVKRTVKKPTFEGCFPYPFVRTPFYF
jgi:hypothetical protein